LAGRIAEFDKQFKERTDKMKNTLNAKLREFRSKDREELETKYNAHNAEIEKLKAEHDEELEKLKASATIKTEASEESKPFSIEDISDAQAKDLVAKHPTIESMVRRNIINANKKTEEKLKSEYEQKMQDAATAAKTSQENAVKMEQMRQNVKLNMTEKRSKDALAKIEVVEKAATDNPQRPVGEVWAIAKQTKAVVITAAAQAAAQPATTSQNAPTASTPSQPVSAAPTPVPSSDSAAAGNQPAASNIPEPSVNTSSLPVKPTQAQGAGAKVLGNLMAGNVPQAGSGIPRGVGRGSRGTYQSGDGNRGGSGIPRGRGGRGGQRGGGHHHQNNNQGGGRGGNVSSSHQNAAPNNNANNANTNTNNQAGRGAGGVGGGGGVAPPSDSGGPNSPMNPNAKQFTPGAGFKRPHDDPAGQGGNAEKRARGNQ
jgi:nucleoprotein TPR